MIFSCIQARKFPGEWNARNRLLLAPMLPFVAEKGLYSGHASVLEHSKLNPTGVSR
jgi:hypothetical protein